MPGQNLTGSALRLLRRPDPDLVREREAHLALAREQFRVLRDLVLLEIGGALDDGEAPDAIEWIEAASAQLARMRETLRHAA